MENFLTFDPHRQFSQWLRRYLLDSATQVIIPKLVDKKSVAKLLGIFQASNHTIEVLGKSCSGILLVTLTLSLFLFDGLSFLLSALSEMFIRLPSKSPEAPKFSLQQSLKKASITSRVTDAVIIFAVLGIGNILAIPAFALMIPFFEHPHHDMSHYGIF